MLSDPQITVDLYEHQIQGVKWMTNREKAETNKGGINADDVGMGKTVMALGTIINNKVPNTLLIVPKTLINQWITEISKFSSGLIIDVPDPKKDNFSYNKDPSKISITIISSSRLNMTGATKWTKYHTVEWDRIIIDEAHCIKNKKTKLHVNCMNLKTDIKWLLTATPVMNKMTDFVHMMGFIGISQHECQTKREEITNEYILHRKNKIDDLPELEVKEVLVPLTVEEDIYKSVEVDVANFIKTQTNHIAILEKLLRLRQICIHPQIFLDGVAKKEKTNSDNWERASSKLIEFRKHLSFDAKCIVFCHFIQEIDIYMRDSIENGYNCLHLDGRLNQDERNTVISKFKDTEGANVHVLFMQINVGGTGYNLQEANKIIFTSPDWTPALEHQAIGRAHRNGQLRKVSVIKLLTTCGDDSISIEMQMLELKKQKESQIHNIMVDAFGNKESRVEQIKAITTSDIKKMFKKTNPMLVS